MKDERVDILLHKELPKKVTIKGATFCIGRSHSYTPRHDILSISFVSESRVVGKRIFFWGSIPYFCTENYIIPIGYYHSLHDVKVKGYSFFLLEG